MASYTQYGGLLARRFNAPSECNLTSAESYQDIADPSKGGVTFLTKMGSGSDTVLFAGRSVRLGENVVGKLFRNPIYDYELRIYSEIVPKLREGAAHFLPKVFVADCEREAHRVLGAIPPELQGVMTRSLPPTVPPVLRLLGTKLYPNTETLALKLVHKRIDAAGCFQVYFQICVALHFIGELRGMHNDLFARNVLVVTLPQPMLFTYTIDNVIYAFASRFRALVFDWDRGYFEQLGPNPQNVANCASINECSIFVAGKDLSTFTCDLFGSFPLAVLTIADLRAAVGAELPTFVSLILFMQTAKLPCRLPRDAGINYGSATPKNILQVLGPKMSLTPFSGSVPF